jgi:hypothetical protein
MGTFPGGNIIRVTPTLSTDAYAEGDVLFASTEIPNAVSSRGGSSFLVGMTVVDYGDVADSDIHYIFSEKQTNLGTVNATADISDADFKASKPTGFLLQDADQATTGAYIDNARMHTVFAGAGSGDGSPGVFMMLKADEGSTSVYISGILKSATTPTYAADGIELIFHIKYLD